MVYITKYIKNYIFTYTCSPVICLCLLCSECVQYKYPHFQIFFISKNDKNSFYIKLCVHTSSSHNFLYVLIVALFISGRLYFSVGCVMPIGLFIHGRRLVSADRSDQSNQSN